MRSRIPYPSSDQRIDYTIALQPKRRTKGYLPTTHLYHNQRRSYYAYSDRYILPFVSNGLETKDEFITQTHTVPWVVMDSRIKTIPASGGRIIVNNFYSNTNCDSVTLSTSVGTITPTEHIGK